MPKLGGYRIDLENLPRLLASCDRYDFGALCAGSAPEELDPRPHIHVEDQGQIGSCQGHSLSSVAEHCLWLATQDTTQLSRWWAYRQTQFLDGIHGDNGSTIEGGVRLGMEQGICREAVCPYPSYYAPFSPTQEMRDDAAKFKFEKKYELKTYADIFAFLATGQGGVHTGSTWGFEPDSGGVVARYVPQGGGHSVPFLGYSPRKDAGGRNYLWLLNSWSQSWGNQGWVEVAPTAVDQMMKNQYSVAIGLSDLTHPVVRQRWTGKDSVF